MSRMINYVFANKLWKLFYISLNDVVYNGIISVLSAGDWNQVRLVVINGRSNMG